MPCFILSFQTKAWAIVNSKSLAPLSSNGPSAASATLTPQCQHHLLLNPKLIQKGKPCRIRSAPTCAAFFVATYAFLNQTIANGQNIPFRAAIR